MGKLETKRPLGRPRYRWDGSSRSWISGHGMDLAEGRTGGRLLWMQ